MRQFPRIAIALACLASQASAAPLPEEYVVTDITGWANSQLASLPYFDRYVPDGASGDYRAIARSGFGVTAGNREFTNAGWVQGSGAFVKDGTLSSIPAWRRSGAIYSYAWSRTWWDGDDVHFQNGFVTHSPVRDVNALGQVVGYSTMPGSGDSSAGYKDHAYIRDTVMGQHVDITPDADRADPRAINDLGEIVGRWSNGEGSHAFRRDADGGFTDFVLAEAPASHSMTPTVLNNRGLVAGSAIVYTVPGRDRRPFVSEAGAATVRLDLPDQNSPDAGTIADVNEHGILVGEAHKAGAVSETNGVRWAKVGGSWQAEDLNELLADHEPEVIIDKAIAINDAGHIIVSGHLDGTDTRNTRVIWLAPEVAVKPSVSTLRPYGVTSSGAVLRAKVNPADRASTYRFVHGQSAPDGAGSAAGTAPVMAELPLTGLSPNTTYSFHATATNSEGTTTGEVRSFTTLWDWPSWSSARGMTSPTGDANNNSLPDLLDFATGSGAPPAVALADGVVKVTYRRSLVADGVTLKIEVSDNLRTWSDAELTDVSRTADGVDHEIVTACISATALRQFTRLTAVQP